MDWRTGQQRTDIKIAKICYDLNQKYILSSDMSFPLQQFLQDKVNPNTYWIGLSYNAKKDEWQWIDNGPSNL